MDDKKSGDHFAFRQTLTGTGQVPPKAPGDVRVQLRIRQIGHVSHISAMSLQQPLYARVASQRIIEYDGPSVVFDDGVMVETN